MKFSMNVPSITTNINIDRSLNQLGFLALPADIILTIFTNLNRSDVLTSMTVAQSWYIDVPQYAQHMWTYLNFHKLEFYKNNNRWKRCLGIHWVPWYQIFSEKCQFIEQLKQLTEQLLELKFIRHPTNLPFIRILRNCPSLCRFTYIPTGDAYKDLLYDTEPIVPDEQHDNNILLSQQQSTFHTLTYLCLDVYMHKQRLEPIVKKCPNLLYLICTTGLLGVHQGFSIVPDYNTNIIDLNKLFNTWCPNLTFLQSNCDCFTSYRQDWSECIIINDGEENKIKRIEGDGTGIQQQQQQQQRERKGGLQYLYTCEAQGYGPTQIAPHIIQNASTLESLLLHGRYYHSPLYTAREDWSSIFLNLTFPNIRRLECCGILLDTFSMTLLLERLPGLEKLAIDVKDMSIQVSRTLKILNRLTHIYLSNTHLVFNVGNSTTGSTNHDDSDASIRLFKELAKRGSQLQVIELDMMPRPATDQLLQAFAYVDTLKKLRIEVNGDLLSDEGFTRFAELLSKNTVIEYLELRYIAYISRSALEALARLKYLKTLRMLSPRGAGIPFYADGTGVLRLLRWSTSLENMFFDSIRLFDPPDSINNMLKRQTFKYELKDIGDYFIDFMQVENYVTLGLTDRDCNNENADS
ncbi:hypothetical protein INT45_011635 [Circinella minor]|uniref:F-box domain-containing protein n=1 Tax=Circinella minor TaxID=1195481 RepID=A0A8H7S632_9FUNG|nr:hypothetical protein INT45_011635 [Circinella minor]